MLGTDRGSLVVEASSHEARQRQEAWSQEAWEAEAHWTGQEGERAGVPWVQRLEAYSLVMVEGASQEGELPQHWTVGEGEGPSCSGWVGRGVEQAGEGHRQTADEVGLSVTGDSGQPGGALQQIHVSRPLSLS